MPEEIENNEPEREVKEAPGQLEQAKICSRCGVPKPFKQFYKNKAAKDGHHFYCKKCQRDYSAEKRAAGKELDPTLVGKYQINIDFKDHTEIYDSLINMATDELRTVENQLIYLIKSRAGIELRD